MTSGQYCIMGGHFQLDIAGKKFGDSLVIPLIHAFLQHVEMIAPSEYGTPDVKNR